MNDADSTNLLDTLMDIWENGFSPELVAKCEADKAREATEKAAREAEKAKKLASMGRRFKGATVRTINGVDYVQCPRCSGQGRIQAYHYHADGICFECGGTSLIRA